MSPPGTGSGAMRVFGSVARGEADERSDVDFLVEMERKAEPPGDLGGLVMDLQDLLGRRVDVVTERGLKQRIRNRVLEGSGTPVRDCRCSPGFPVWQKGT